MSGDEIAARLVAAGVAGCNLEDTDHARGGLVDPAWQAARMAELRRAAQRLGVPLVINARVDVYVRGIGEPSERLELTVQRGRRYLAAGADCIYPITVADEPTIQALVDAFEGRINIYARPEAPSLARLAALGVARISFGPRIHRLAMEAVDAALRAVLAGRDPAGIGRAVGDP